jgi:hypothetical protein
VAVGALFLVVLSNGMNLSRLPSYVQEVVLGAPLIAIRAATHPLCDVRPQWPEGDPSPFDRAEATEFGLAA